MELRPLSITVVVEILLPKKDPILSDVLTLKAEGDIFMVALNLLPDIVSLDGKPNDRLWRDRIKIELASYHRLRDQTVRHLLSLVRPEWQQKVMLALVGFFSLLDATREDSVCHQIAEMLTVMTLALVKEEL